MNEHREKIGGLRRVLIGMMLLAMFVAGGLSFAPIRVMADSFIGGFLRDTVGRLAVNCESGCNTPIPAPTTTPGNIPKSNPVDAAGNSFTSSNPLQTNAAQGTAAASSASWPFFLYGVGGTNQAGVDSSNRLLTLASQSGAPWSVNVANTPAPVPWPTPTAGAAAPANAPPVVAYETCQNGSNQNVTAGNAIAVQCDNNGRIIVNLSGQGNAITVKPNGYSYQTPFVITNASATTCTAISTSGALLFEITNASTAAQTVTLKLFNDNASCAAGNNIVAIILGASQTVEFGGFGKLFPAGMSYTLSAAATSNISIGYAK